MKKLLFAVCALAVLAGANSVYADLKIERETRFEFSGALGLVMKMAGANKPTRTAEYYDDTHHRSDNYDEKGQLTFSTIIDLKNEKVIHVDYQAETFTEFSFQDYKDMMEQSIEDMKTEQQQAKEKQDTEVEYTFDLDVKQPGETKEISGYKASKTVLEMKLSVKATETREHETAEMSGDLKVNSIQWMSKSVPGYKQVQQFQEKFVRQVGGMSDEQAMKDVYESLSASHPQLGTAMKKLQDEKEKLEGLSLLSETEYMTENVDQKTESQESSGTSAPSVNKLFGGLSKKLAEKVTGAGEKKSNLLFKTVDTVTLIESAILPPSTFETPQGFERITETEM
ncbi:MAG: hypothetical protein U5R06_17525 [candidate division KSB1 bacterium]|nr:hypothetical protein [candidate division KSB1 bacterium]